MSQRTIPINPADKCGRCHDSICCTYVTHPIDTPRSKADFDYLLWQVSHRGVAAFREDGAWYLRIAAPCEHLAADGGCGIYATRPRICRDHGNDYCEYDAPAVEAYELWFDHHAALDAYCRQRFTRWDERFGDWGVED